MLIVDKSIGSLQAFEGRANRVKGAIEGVEAEGTKGAVRAKVEREESYWTTRRNCEYLVRSSSYAARRFLIVPDRLYRKAAIL
jgi:hypothetical protein